MSNMIGVKHEKPNRRDDIRDAMYDSWVDMRKSERPRMFLGASDIGRECPRSLWYAFHWAMKRTFVGEGRLLRLFNRGHREEPVVEEEFRRIGIPITTISDGGGQHNFGAVYGHSRVNLDGIVEVKDKDGLNTRKMTLEIKTANGNKFKKFDSDGVKVANPQYYGQIQWQLWVAEQNGVVLDGCIFVVACKNTDNLYVEEVGIDKNEQERLKALAESIVIGDAPPPLTSSENAAPCRFCDFKPICREEQYHLIDRNCRTCEYGKTTDNAGWTCTAGHPFGTVCEDWSMKKGF